MIGPIFYLPSKTLYAIADGVGADAGKVRNVVDSVWEVLDTSPRTEYDVALTETPAASGKYYASLPSGLSALIGYRLAIYEQAGGSPSTSDAMVSAATVGPISANLEAWEGVEVDLVDVSTITPNDISVTVGQGS